MIRPTVRRLSSCRSSVRIADPCSFERLQEGMGRHGLQSAGEASDPPAMGAEETLKRGER
jgi:hypothetical protein